MKEVSVFVAQLNESLSRVNAKVIALNTSILFIEYNGTECNIAYGFKKKGDPTSEFKCAVTMANSDAPLAKDTNKVNICCFVAKMAENKDVAHEVIAILKEFAKSFI